MSKLVPVQELQPAFDNAVEYLHRKLAHAYPSELMTVGNFARHFKEEFDCYALWDSNFNWDVVGFQNEEQHMMFVLKWS